MRTHIWLGEKITIGFVVAFATLFLLSSLARRSIERAQSATDWMTHTYEVNTALGNLLTAVITVETEQRGFVMTADPLFLTSYRHAFMQVQPLVERVSSLTADNPEQQQRLVTLKNAVRDRLAFADHVVTLAQTQPSAALAQIGTGQGLTLTTVIRAHIQEMQAAERALLTQRTDAVRAQTKNTLWLLDLSNGIALILAVLAGVAIRRDLKKRQSVQAQLQTAHDALEQRVQERTAELTQLNTALVQVNTNLQEVALAQEQARKENARLARYNQLLLESIGEGIYSIDAQGCCTFLNQRGAQMLGLTPTDALGKDMHALIHHHHPDNTPYPIEECPISQALRSGQGCRIDSEVFWRRDKTSIPVEYAAFPLEGAAAGAVVSFTDITIRKQVEATLQEAKQAAEDANRAKSQFLANMSHELRTPLNAVILYSELLQEEAEELGATALTQDLEKIRGAGKHLLSLINDVLDLSKIEAEKIELHAEHFAVTQMVNEVIATIEPLAQKRVNQLTVQCAPDVGAMNSDLTRIRQCLFNLLSNACKFTENGLVSLEVAREQREAQDWLRFRVSDTGIGMTAEQLQKLFQPFTQVDASTTRKFGGTGLGLTITKQFCELMGGFIEVDSTIEKGSHFTLYLPAQLPEDMPTIAPSSTGQSAGPSGAPLVLVVDDDPRAREQIQQILAEEGFHVVTAASGEEGLRCARELRPQVITLDVIMPHMDGWSVLANLKSDPGLADIPVIMLTTAHSEDLGYALGAAEYLVKPLEEERVAAVVRKYQNGAAHRVVLIVEDDSLTRQMLRTLLERQGWTVREATNGRAGLAALYEPLPALIVLDLMMPEMDGFTFVNELRAKPSWRDIPVLVLTAKDLTRRERERLQGAVQRVFQKGITSRKQLVHEIQRFIAPTKKQEAARAEE
jgi:PAS domain S-box-containing protein